MHNVLAALDAAENVATILGVAAFLICIVVMIVAHAGNDKKHLKEGETPMTLPMCEQVHKGWQQCITILTEAVKSNETRSTESVKELKDDMHEQFKILFSRINCLEGKIVGSHKGD